MPANSVNARMHLKRCAGGNFPNVSSVFSICCRSASDRVLSVFFFSTGVSSKNWLNWAVIFWRWSSESVFQCAKSGPRGPLCHLGPAAGRQRRAVGRIHVREIAQGALALQKFRPAMAAAGCPIAGDGFSPGAANHPEWPPAARRGSSEIRAGGAANTSAIRWRAGAIRARSGRAPRIRAPWRECGRGFPAAGSSGNFPARRVSSPAVRGTNPRVTSSAAGAAARDWPARKIIFAEPEPCVTVSAASWKTAIWPAATDHEPVPQSGTLPRMNHCIKASNSSSACWGWLMRRMASKFSSASGLGIGCPRVTSATFLASAMRWR